MIKILKYSLKLGKKKQVNADCADFDAILRYRALHPPSSYAIEQSQELQYSSTGQLVSAEQSYNNSQKMALNGKISKSTSLDETVKKLNVELDAKDYFRDDQRVAVDGYTDIPLDSEQQQQALQAMPAHAQSRMAKKKKGSKKSKPSKMESEEMVHLSSERMHSTHSGDHNPIVRVREGRGTGLNLFEALETGQGDDDDDYSEHKWAMEDARELESIKDSEWQATLGPLAGTCLDCGEYYSDGKGQGMAGERREMDAINTLDFLDGLKVLGFLWLLASAIVSILSLFVKDFSSWPRSAGAFGDVLSSSHYTNGYTVLFVVLGYAVPNLLVGSFENSSKSDAAPTPLLPTTKRCAYFLVRGFFRIVPALAVTIILGSIFGSFSNNSIIHLELYTTCSKNWWTNFLFMTNLSVLWLGPTTVYDFQSTDDGSGITADYADFSACFPSMWALSCAVQMTVMSMPFISCFVSSPSWGTALCVLWVVSAVVMRTVIANSASTSLQFAQSTYFAPWTRGDAFGLGLLVYMLRQSAFVPGVVQKIERNERRMRLARGSLQGMGTASPSKGRRRGETKGILASALGAVYDTVLGWSTAAYSASSSKRGPRGLSEEEKGLLSNQSDLDAMGSSRIKRPSKKKPRSGLGGPGPLHLSQETDSDFLEAMEHGLRSARLSGRNESDAGVKSGVGSGLLFGTREVGGDGSDESHLSRGGRRDSRHEKRVSFLDDARDTDSIRSAAMSSVSTITLDPPPPTPTAIATRIAWGVVGFSLLGLGLYTIMFNSSDVQMKEALHLSAWQIQNATLTVVAVCTAMILSLCEDPIFWPLRSLLAFRLWVPFSQLAFCCYLTHMLAIFFFASHLPGTNTLWGGNAIDFAIVYFQILVVTLVSAALLFVAVERPLYEFTVRVLRLYEDN